MDNEDMNTIIQIINWMVQAHKKWIKLFELNDIENIGEIMDVCINYVYDHVIIMLKIDFYLINEIVDRNLTRKLKRRKEQYYKTLNQLCYIIFEHTRNLDNIKFSCERNESLYRNIMQKIYEIYN